jgi:hypothetical protein
MYVHGGLTTTATTLFIDKLLPNVYVSFIFGRTHFVFGDFNARTAHTFRNKATTTKGVRAVHQECNTKVRF